MLLGPGAPRWSGCVVLAWRGRVPIAGRAILLAIVASMISRACSVSPSLRALHGLRRIQKSPLVRLCWRPPMSRRCCSISASARASRLALCRPTGKSARSSAAATRRHFPGASVPRSSPPNCDAAQTRDWVAGAASNRRTSRFWPSAASPSDGSRVGCFADRCRRGERAVRHRPMHDIHQRCAGGVAAPLDGDQVNALDP